MRVRPGPLCFIWDARCRWKFGDDLAISVMT